MQKYKRLTPEEREEISRGIAFGYGIYQIAHSLGRSESTIYREVKRYEYHWLSWMGYRAMYAERGARKRAASRKKGKTKLEKCPALKKYVHEKLNERWSPNQIAKKIVVEYPHEKTMRISPDTIYDYVYILPRGELKKTLIKGLRQEHKKRKTRKNISSKLAENRGKIADMLSIEERPKEVEDRIIPGHWESDLIIGKRGGSAIGTLVERTTRYTMLVPLKARDATTVREAFQKAMQNIPQDLRKTLTHDQGKEMSEHKKFTISTGIQVYFAHPHSPWERGTNENTNGLIRQYFPKGTDFRMITNEELYFAQNQLNGRPRKAIGYLNPYEAFNSLLR